MFNLTMSYRADSDIFLPYGYLVSHHSTHGHPLNVPSSSHPRPYLLAWVISNWAESQARVAFYRQLSRYVRVDVFGQAGLDLPGDSLVRTVSAKALGAMVKGMGETCFDDLLPWLMETLASEQSSVDRSGDRKSTRLNSSH